MYMHTQNDKTQTRGAAYDMKNYGVCTDQPISLQCDFLRMTSIMLDCVTATRIQAIRRMKVDSWLELTPVGGHILSAAISSSFSSDEWYKSWGDREGLSPPKF